MIRDILSRLVARHPERGAVVTSARPQAGRVHAVFPVSEPRTTPSRLALEVRMSPSGQHPIRHSIRATRALLLAGKDVATDGCKVAPFTYCQHGCPGHGILWGGLGVD